jgi:adenylosuccinate lyase
VTALENVTLWHERDISHSSAERIMFPDATGLLDFMLDEATRVVEGLEVFPDRMLDHVMAHGGIAFSQAALLALVEAGWDRDRAYQVVQSAASAAWDRDDSFRDALALDPSVRDALGPEEMEQLFDPARFLRNLSGVFDRLEKLPVDEEA